MNLDQSLGSDHDGAAGTYSILCNPSDNFIMTAVTGAYQTNLFNQLLFSNCSIKAFKYLLLSSDYGLEF